MEAAWPELQIKRPWPEFQIESSSLVKLLRQEYFCSFWQYSQTKQVPICKLQSIFFIIYPSILKWYHFHHYQVPFANHRVLIDCMMSCTAIVPLVIVRHSTCSMILVSHITFSRNKKWTNKWLCIIHSIHRAYNDISIRWTTYLYF